MPVLTALFIYLGITPFLERPSSSAQYFFLPSLAIGFIALTAWAFLEVQRERIIITTDRIIQVSAFKTKELPFNLVKGYTEDKQYLRILPSEEGFPTIKISPYTGGLLKLKEELITRFTDLDNETLIAEEEELLQDETLGTTEEERSVQLKQIRKTTRICNTTAWVISIWLFLYPRPYELLVYGTMAFFAIVLYILYKNKGLIRIDEKPKTAYPNLANAIILPSLMIMLRALLDFDIFDYHRLWQWVIAGTLALFTFILYSTRAFTNKKQIASNLIYLIFTAAFNFGAIVETNCLPDTSQPQHYTTPVLDKRVSKGKTTTYYLKLSAWGSKIEPDDVSVNKSLYDRVGIGDNVHVYLKQGALHIPWFIVTD
jgi:hypothetical protein